MVETGAGAKNTFRQVENIQLADRHHQSYGYFGLACIGYVVNVLPNPFLVPDLINLATITQELNISMKGRAKIR